MGDGAVTVDDLLALGLVRPEQLTRIRNYRGQRAYSPAPVPSRLAYDGAPARGLIFSRSAQSIPTGVETTVTDWTTTELNNLSGSTYTTGVLTISAEDAGVWALAGGVRFSTPSAEFEYAATLSGALLGVSTTFGIDRYRSVGFSTPPSLNVFRLARLQAGDSVRLTTTQSTGASASIGGGPMNFFSAVRIGPAA